MKWKYFDVLFAATLLGASCSVLAQTGQPTINKIDPPNWWTEMPSPMLLIHGEHLSGAHVIVSGTHVSRNALDCASSSPCSSTGVGLAAVLMMDR